MNRHRLKLALACAAMALACAPAATAASAVSAYVPGEVIVGYDGGGSQLVELAPGIRVSDAIGELRRRRGVEFATPNWIATASLTPLDRGTSGEPGGWHGDQWSLTTRPGGIRVPGAWDQLIRAGAPGGVGVTVAVVDTGIAASGAPGFLPSPDFGESQLAPGIDLVDDDAQAQDANGHGTHVAGTIGEQITLDEPSADDDYLAGIAYGARLMPIRVLDADGVGSTDDVAAGILWAARNGADVINLSLNFDPMVNHCSEVPIVCTAVRKATRLGALVVASAGNSTTGPGSGRALFPSAAPKAFAVGATTEHGCLADYSHYGKGTDLLAPGGGEPRARVGHPVCAEDDRPVLQLTYDCFPQGCAGVPRSYEIRPDVGTSMSAAHVSAVAALVIASRAVGVVPSPKTLSERLKCTARAPTSHARFYGNGIVDALRAVSPKRRCAR